MNITINRYNFLFTIKVKHELLFRCCKTLDIFWKRHHRDIMFWLGHTVHKHTQAAPCSVFLNRSLAKVNSTAEHEIPPFYFSTSSSLSKVFIHIFYVMYFTNNIERLDSKNIYPSSSLKNCNFFLREQVSTNLWRVRITKISIVGYLLDIY